APPRNRAPSPNGVNGDKRAESGTGFAIGLAQPFTKHHQVVAVGVEIADTGVFLVAVLLVEAAGRLVVCQRRRFYEEQTPPGSADFVLGVVQELRADATRLRLLGHE